VYFALIKPAYLLGQKSAIAASHMAPLIGIALFKLLGCLLQGRKSLKTCLCHDQFCFPDNKISTVKLPILMLDLVNFNPFAIIAP
jgi:hypothetical protein